ncbi:MAG: hypothetical protein ABEK01_05905 [Candidatus Nanohaloarchaea archaeon]
MVEPPVEVEKVEKAPLKAKKRAGEQLLVEALEDSGSLSVEIDGSRDSVLAAWMLAGVCEEEGFDKPGFTVPSVPEEVEEFVKRVADRLGFSRSGTGDLKVVGSREASSYVSDDRIHPLLPFTDEEAWELTWEGLVADLSVELDEIPESHEELPEDIEPADLPVWPGYWKGRAPREEDGSGEPSWVSGEESREEDIKDKLRDLGYS